MKTTRALGLFLLGMLVQSSLFAQTVSFLIVSKSHQYTQTDNSTTVDFSTPWGFDAHVEGTNSTTDLQFITPPTLTIPGGTGSTTPVYNISNNAWEVRTSYGTQGLLDGAYADGSFSWTALGQTVSGITVSGGTYPVAPLATNLSGGTISGGVLLWDVAQALTITITGVADHMGIFVDGNSYNDGIESFGVGTITFIVPALSLTAGNSYTVKLDFDDIVGGTNVSTVGSGALTGASYVGVYNAETTFTIQAIPEPATYVEFFGLVALAGVMFQRRRRLA
jgi:hypothetical protein